MKKSSKICNLLFLIGFYAFLGSSEASALGLAQPHSSPHPQHFGLSGNPRHDYRPVQRAGFIPLSNPPVQQRTLCGRPSRHPCDPLNQWYGARTSPDRVRSFSVPKRTFYRRTIYPNVNHPKRRN